MNIASANLGVVRSLLLRFRQFACHPLKNTICKGGPFVGMVHGWRSPNEVRQSKMLAPPFCWTKFRKKSREIWNEVSEISQKFAPKFAPKCSPKYPVLSWQVEKSSPKISPAFSHPRFQISNRIPNQVSPKCHKHTSAGLAALRKWSGHCMWCESIYWITEMESSENFSAIQQDNDSDSNPLPLRSRILLGQRPLPSFRLLPWLPSLRPLPWYEDVSDVWINLISCNEALLGYVHREKKTMSATWRTEIAAMFAIRDCDARRRPQKSITISKTRQNNAALPFEATMEMR